MKATCPNDPAHDRFYTTAHVAQTWEVDREGNFVSDLSTDEVTHFPDPDNTWQCKICGADATVER